MKKKIFREDDHIVVETWWGNERKLRELIYLRDYARIVKIARKMGWQSPKAGPDPVESKQTVQGEVDSAEARQ